MPPQSRKCDLTRHRRQRRRGTESWLQSLSRAIPDMCAIHRPRSSSMPAIRQVTDDFVRDASITLRRYRTPRLRRANSSLAKSVPLVVRSRPECEPLPDSDEENEDPGDATSDHDTLLILMRWHDDTTPSEMTRLFGVYPDTIPPESLSSEAVRSSSDESDRLRTSCYMCNCRIGESCEDGKEAEKKVYLPCGHWFGHVCIFGWLSHRRDASGIVKCPRPGCTTIRHCCSHLAAPSLYLPLIFYNSPGSRKIPWDCNFCMTDQGKALRDAVSRASIRTRKAATGRYFTSFLRRMYNRQLTVAEHELQSGERAWAAANWKSIMEAPLIKMIADDFDDDETRVAVSNNSMSDLAGEVAGTRLG